jgi:hypothetical protein
MKEDKNIRIFIELTRSCFPNAARKTDEKMKNMGFDNEDKAYFTWIESFADITNALIHERMQVEVEKHLIFFSQQFEIGSESVKNCIDVSYVENLMWNLDSEDKTWAWSLIPENLKSVYIDMWDESSWMTPSTNK